MPKLTCVQCHDELKRQGGKCFVPNDVAFMMCKPYLPPRAVPKSFGSPGTDPEFPRKLCYFRGYGYDGNGYFCTLTCAYWYAVNHARKEHPRS